jgi:formylglycine-generating enzyme required for sulfatase activity
MAHRFELDRGIVNESIVPGKERINERDGSVLVFVPGGEYLLDEGSLRHRVILTPFWIGKYTVTNEQYSRFLTTQTHQKTPEYWDDSRFNDPRQPVVGVSWMESLTYCRWAGLDLPSGAQWEAAARGTDSRPYPWGSDGPSSNLARFGGDWETGKPAPVGSYPKGAGPFGTVDQAGNVSEWCWDEFKRVHQGRDGRENPIIRGDERDESALRETRGGSWADLPEDLLAAGWTGVSARTKSWDLGFRVACRFGPENST